MLNNEDHEKYCWKLKVVTFAICVTMPGEMLQKPTIYENLCQLKKLLQLKSDCKQKVTVVFRTAIFVLLSFYNFPTSKVYNHQIDFFSQRL